MKLQKSRVIHTRKSKLTRKEKLSDGIKNDTAAILVISHKILVITVEENNQLRLVDFLQFKVYYTYCIPELYIKKYLTLNIAK